MLRTFFQLLNKNPGSKYQFANFQDSSQFWIWQILKFYEKIPKKYFTVSYKIYKKIGVSIFQID